MGGLSPEYWDWQVKQEMLTMSGAEAIAAERQRQIEREGWTPEHDDEHTDCSLSAAAACYARPFKIEIDGYGLRFEELEGETDDYTADMPLGWPESWTDGWWKPRDYRSNLVRAGALLAAEIDRIDRLAKKTPEGDNNG